MPDATVLVIKIIEEQGQIIGSELAYSRALSTDGINMNGALSLTEEPTTLIDKLLAAYSEVFGQASLDVCIDVIKTFPYNDVAPFLSDKVKRLVKSNTHAPIQN
jgi:hypothetical protein